MLCLFAMRGIVQCKATTTSYSAKCTAMQQPQNAFSICSICSHSQYNAIQCCLQIEFLHCETCCFKKFSDNKFEKTALQSPCSHPLTFSFLSWKWLKSVLEAITFNCAASCLKNGGRLWRELMQVRSDPLWVGRELEEVVKSNELSKWQNFT